MLEKIIKKEAEKKMEEIRKEYRIERPEKKEPRQWYPEPYLPKKEESEYKKAPAEKKEPEYKEK